MDEMRAKNLCFWRDERYIPGHKCKKKQLFVLQVKEIIDEGELDTMIQDIEAEEYCIQQAQISLNALWGTGGNQTMIIRGFFGRRRMQILIDTGSTHNFLNDKLASELQNSVVPVPGLWVEIANGQANTL